MLSFSFSTVLMALITSSILVGLIAIVFQNDNTLACAGYKLLGVIGGSCWINGYSTNFSL